MTSREQPEHRLASAPFYDPVTPLCICGAEWRDGECQRPHEYRSSAPAYKGAPCVCLRPEKHPKHIAREQPPGEPVPKAWCSDWPKACTHHTPAPAPDLAAPKRDAWVESALRDYTRLAEALRARGITEWDDTVTAVLALLPEVGRPDLAAEKEMPGIWEMAQANRLVQECGTHLGLVIDDLADEERVRLGACRECIAAFLADGAAEKETQTICTRCGYVATSMPVRPINKQVADLAAENAVLRQALERIERWELPATGKFWPSGNPISYQTEYGSNGARDYMREVARTALAGSAAKVKDHIFSPLAGGPDDECFHRGERCGRSRKDHEP